MPHCRTTLILLSSLVAGMPASATTPAATLRFGTVCAHCHEGECSGRLSFARRPEAAFQHIRQYAGPTDDELARQLYRTLEQMKSDCSYPRLTAPAIERGLDAGDLAPYREPWSGDYFLPLGPLAPGQYRLAIEFDGGGRVRVEVIDAEFDPLIDRCLTPEDQRLNISLTLEDERAHYLRLRPRGPLRVRGMTLTPSE